MLGKIFISFMLILLPSVVCFADFPKIIPGKVWLDDKGNVINAHGGSIIKCGKKYYWFGEQRVKWGFTSKASVYSSNNLYNWHYEGVALDLTYFKNRHAIERPKVIYNKKNNEFVMWFHEELNNEYVTAKAGVAISKNILGPYKYIHDVSPKEKNQVIENSDEKNQFTDRANSIFHKSEFQEFRDMNLYVENNKAYVVYASEQNLTIHISQLNDDFTDVSGNFSRVAIGGKNEAPVLFKKNDKYFLITSGLKGFNPTNSRLFISNNIYGPWKKIGSPIKDNNIQLVNKSFLSQSTSVIQINEKYIYMADRWNADDLTDSRYVWLPINWSKSETPYVKWKNLWSW